MASVFPAISSMQNAYNTQFIFLSGLLMSFTGLLVGAELVPSGVWVWGACLYYIALCWYGLKYHPGAFVLLLWFIFIRFTTMISGIAIENYGYMPEVLLQGEPTGAFVRLAGVYTAGILFCFCFLDFFKRFIPDPLESRTKQYWSTPVLIAVALICLGACMIGFKHGFPLFTGVDRMLYWKQVDSRFFYFFLGNRPIFALFLGLIFSIEHGTRRHASTGVLLGMLFISFLFSEKFASICLIIFSFVTPVFLRDSRHLDKLVSRIVPLGGILALITLPAVLVVYGFAENPGAALERLQIRATSQAQIWYIADQDQEHLWMIDFKRVEHNISSFLSRSPDAYQKQYPYLGVRDFMAGYMDEDRYEHYAERGVALTLGTEGYLLKIFGFLGMIPAYIFILGVYCLYLTYLYFAVISVNPVRLLIIAKVLVWNTYGLNQGYFYPLLGWKPIGIMAAVLLIELTFQFFNKKQSE